MIEVWVLMVYYCSNDWDKKCQWLVMPTTYSSPESCWEADAAIGMSSLHGWRSRHERKEGRFSDELLSPGGGAFKGAPDVYEEICAPLLVEKKEDNNGQPGVKK